jgi:hypothetical protein
MADDLFRRFRSHYFAIVAAVASSQKVVSAISAFSALNQLRKPD